MKKANKKKGVREFVELEDDSSDSDYSEEEEDTENGVDTRRLNTYKRVEEPNNTIMVIYV